MSELTNSQKLLALLKDEYLDSGYLYSGSVPYACLYDQGFRNDDINVLVQKGLVQKRQCEGVAYELTAPERHKLLSKHSLCSKWFSAVGNAFREAIQDEARSASLVSPCPHDAHLLTVDVMKRQGADNIPNKVDISRPFSVGQIIQVEYDLPSQLRYSGYSHCGRCPGGVAVGSFMVTDILCNSMINPPINMIELQSLSEEFNAIHPNDRTMLLFEDVVIKRTREPFVPLSEQIEAATSSTGKSKALANTAQKEDRQI